MCTKSFLYGLLIVISASIVFYWVMKAVGATDNYISIGVSACFASQALFVQWIEQRNQPRIAIINRIVSYDFFIKPVIVIFYAVCYLQFCERFLGGIGGGLFGIFFQVIAKVFNVPLDIYSREANQVILSCVPIFVFIFDIPLIFYMSKIIRYRTKIHPYLVVVTALIINNIINLIIAYRLPEPGLVAEFGGLKTALIAQSVYVLFESLVAYAGVCVAKRDREKYVMKLLFSKLSKQDKVDLIGLVSTLPSIR